MIQMAGIRLRKSERVIFENPDIARKLVDFDMTNEAVQHRLFLLKKAAHAKKEVKK